MTEGREAAPLRIGVIGVGEMGRPLVDRLAAAGHRVAAHVRRPELKTELAALGVEVAPSVEALARDRDFVILYVYADEQVKQLALDDGLVEAMDAGATLVIHTTGSPKTALAIAARAKPRGVRVVDAAGSGGPAKVAAGEVTLLVGGAAEDVAHCGTLFAAYANPVLHVGPLGSGQSLKLINNAMFGAHIQLALEACRLAGAFGIDAGDLARAFEFCSGDSAAMRILSQIGSPEALVRGAGRFVHKDVTAAARLAAELGVDLGSIGDVTAPLLAKLEAAQPTR
jgi:3-hydroxyisobutyrate dehydrogenase-like beta-hydroxyacid dehydrogenase